MAERPLAFSFVLSLLFHLTVFILLLAWQRSNYRNAPLVSRIKQAMVQQSAARTVQTRKSEPKPVVEKETPMLFVEVDPATIAPEPPKQAKYYSAVSSRAANPDPKIDSAIPKIDGKQERIVRTFDAPRSQAKPLQPTPAPLAKAEPLRPQTLAPPTQIAEKPAEKAAEPAPKAVPPPGNTMLAKADTTPQVTTSQANTPPAPPAPERPRTLAAARMQQQRSIAGERMKQEGGVKRYALQSSLDVIASPFGAYDARIIAAIQQRWYSLLDQRDFARDRTGKVVLEFRLYSDGSVSDMTATETTVGDLLAYLCQRAVLDPAKYDPWPSDMKRMVGRDYRDVRFTFFYN